MKAVSCLLVLCAGIAYGQNTGAAPEANLLKNPSFEEGANAPTPWEFSTATVENFDLTFSKDAHDGKRSMKVVTKTPKMSGYWTQKVDVAPDTEYLLECWVKLQGGKVLMYVSGQGEEPDKQNRVYVESAHDNPLVPVFLKPEYVGGLVRTDQWHRMDLRFKTLSATKQVRVNIGSYFREGAVLIDDAKLVQAPPAADAKEKNK